MRIVDVHSNLSGIRFVVLFFLVVFLLERLVSNFVWCL